MHENQIKCLKKPKTFDEQINILEKRNLVIEDKEKAKKTLSQINYYRLSGYFRYFYKQGKDEFKDNTTFDDLYNLYKFDESLRRLIMNLTEVVEIKFRTFTSYYIAHNFGELGYLNIENFNERSKPYHEKLIENINNKINLYKDKEFIKHHIRNYGGKLPIWVVVEVLSFNELSRLYGNMTNKDRKAIINNNYDDISIRRSAINVSDWLKVLTDVRNTCAHYERLFNKRFTNSIKLPLQYKGKVFNNTVFSALIILKFLINDNEIWDEFIMHLKALFEKYKFNDLSSMGFPENWEEII